MVVWELQLERRGRPERVSVSSEHRGQAITALCWDTTALRVFAGDSGGKVSFLRAGSSKLGKVRAALFFFPITTRFMQFIVAHIRIFIRLVSY